MGDRSASTPDCATAYPPMMAVTALTSTIGFIADSQSGSSGRRYQIRYCATVQASVGPSTSTFAVFRAVDSVRRVHERRRREKKDDGGSQGVEYSLRPVAPEAKTWRRRE